MSLLHYYYVITLLLQFVSSRSEALGFHVLLFYVAKMMFVEQMPHEAEEEEENTDSLVSTVLEALGKLDEHLQESSADVSLSWAGELFVPSAVWPSTVFLQVLPGTLMDEVQHLCVPPEVIHQLLERDMLLSAEEHLELYDSPIVLDLDAGERPLPTTAAAMMLLAVLDENEADRRSASPDRNGTAQPLGWHHLVSPPRLQSEVPSGSNTQRSISLVWRFYWTHRDAPPCSQSATSSVLNGPLDVFCEGPLCSLWVQRAAVASFSFTLQDN